MAINVYPKGDLVRCTAVFRNVAGVATDPTAVLFKFRTPAGVTTTYTYGVDGQLVKDSTGNYHVDLSASQAAEWFYRWEGTGSVQAAEESLFVVSPSAF